MTAPADASGPASSESCGKARFTHDQDKTTIEANANASPARDQDTLQAGPAQEAQGAVELAEQS
jgi:hypothetical protein